MDRNGNKVIAVDFDGTLSLEKYPNCGKPNKKLFGTLILEKLKGSRIILHTCRTDKLLEDAVNFCREQGLEFDAVNENLPDNIEYYGGDTRKINADVYIDDKAENPKEPKTVTLLFERIKEEMCDKFCKYPLMPTPEGKDDEWLITDDDSPCNNCPLNRL